MRGTKKNTKLTFLLEERTFLFPLALIEKSRWRWRKYVCWGEEKIYNTMRFDGE